MASLASLATLGAVVAIVHSRRSTRDAVSTAAISTAAGCDPTANSSCVVHSNGSVFEVCPDFIYPNVCVLPGDKRRRRRLQTAAAQRAKEVAGGEDPPRPPLPEGLDCDPAFDADKPRLELEIFEPMVRNVFAEAKHSVYKALQQ